MRGKGLGTNHGLERRGITPACAGKRRFSLPDSWSWRDHPRMCGEKHNFWFIHQIFIGSPPRMRGKVFCSVRRNAAVRITPAYAGKSAVPRYRPAVHWDHPRVCGEKRGKIRYRRCDQGSPPRMRGKGTTPRSRNTPPGITPAYAGKSLSEHSLKSGTKDHPRVCGEKTKKIP